MPKFIPALADLKQDIAGPIPVEIIQTWLESDQTDETHHSILDQYKRVGTMISSDSAGLSKLSANKTLMETMKLVSQPKEIIFAHGQAIGGQAIGVWAADNTQMFYDESIELNQIVTQMIAAQQEINQNCEVKVGMGIHTGFAYEIGGGLYGAEADKIEDFTEEKTDGQEIAVSPEVAAKLNSELSSKLVQRPDSMFSIDYADLTVSSQKEENIFYPAPFHRAFHKELIATDVTTDSGRKTLNDKYLQETCIVLVKVFHESTPRLLDDFIDRAAVNTVLYQVLNNFEVEVVKANGALAILETKNLSQATDFALAVRHALQEKEYSANVGLAHGEALIFDLDGGGRDLAGSPINLASKLAEDTEERGMIYLHSSVSEHAKQHGQTEEFKIEKSGVTISGIKIK